MMFIQEMSESDCFDALTRARLGRLACAHDNQPYVVPVYIVYEEPYLYGFTTLGQKVDWMRSNPLVCVELDEVVNFGQWTSILLFGRYEELPELPGTPEFDQEQRREHEPWQAMVRPTSESSTPGQQARLHAHELLQEHRVPWWEPGGASGTHRNPDQPSLSIFYRIRIDRITGRRAMPSHGGRVG
jgi:nitroimidazol reductase NimA-like FMN-containing flavoprotein (pyridoxamine 5'-phosphate oxidase superfamily)